MLPPATWITPSDRFHAVTKPPTPPSALMSPDGPSAQTDRASPNVGAQIAHSPGPLSLIQPASVSAPVLVLPAPRPPRRYHVRQSPAGGSCSGRARVSHRSRLAAANSFCLSDSGQFIQDGEDSFVNLFQV